MLACTGRYAPCGTPTRTLANTRCRGARVPSGESIIVARVVLVFCRCPASRSRLLSHTRVVHRTRIARVSRVSLRKWARAQRESVSLCMCVRVCVCTRLCVRADCARSARRNAVSSSRYGVVVPGRVFWARLRGMPRPDAPQSRYDDHHPLAARRRVRSRRDLIAAQRYPQCTSCGCAPESLAMSSVPLIVTPSSPPVRASLRAL